MQMRIVSLIAKYLPDDILQITVSQKYRVRESIANECKSSKHVFARYHVGFQGGRRNKRIYHSLGFEAM
ncbi:hypothetical protein BGC07_02075 [Piscirickettsia litoralis]|uniref:Uncharacterized protein n=1 Tax=Piscirickettsia litoralis TaxID=1891921 RepID=A0ABX2ZZP2_9GAMM|nr:hypothetical protein BGC07_02075 [Piscirickettsia litoralis]